MSKNYNEVSRQCACLQTSVKTFAVYPRLSRVPVERYAELAEGKIKLLINDFRNGKGDGSVKVTYNLDIKQILPLYLRAQQTWNEAPYSFKDMKIWSQNEPDREGKVPAFEIEIRYASKDKDGRPMGYPWKIRITNGKARPEAVGGTGAYKGRIEQGDRPEVAEFNMSPADMLDWLRKTTAFIENYERLAANTLIPQGERLVLENEERGTRTASRNVSPARAEGRESAAPGRDAQGQAPAASGNTRETPGGRGGQAPGSPDDEAMWAMYGEQGAGGSRAKAGNAGARNKEAPPAKEETRRAGSGAGGAGSAGGKTSGTMDVVMTSGFAMLRDGAVATFSCKGKEYTVTVPADAYDRVSGLMAASYERQRPIRLSIRVEGKKLICGGAEEIAA